MDPLDFDLEDVLLLLLLLVVVVVLSPPNNKELGLLLLLFPFSISWGVLPLGGIGIPKRYSSAWLFFAWANNRST